MKHFQRSGNLLDFDDLDNSSINLSDLLHSLSLENRYSGNIDWSVLKHSLTLGRTAKKMGLMDVIVNTCYLHDLHEAIIRDIPTPFKRQIGDAWYKAEHDIQSRLLHALGVGNSIFLTSLYNTQFKLLDASAAYFEAKHFFPQSHIDWFQAHEDCQAYNDIAPFWEEAFQEIFVLPSFVHHSVNPKIVAEIQKAIKESTAVVS